MTFPENVTRFSSEVAMETRTMDTEIDVPNPRFELVPGMYADVSIVLDARPDALTIPVQGLDRVGGNATAYVVNSEGKVEERQVSTGIETANRIEILSGLREGELVVLGNHGSLRAGEKVQAKQSSLPLRREAANVTIFDQESLFHYRRSLMIVAVGLVSLVRMPVDLFPTSICRKWWSRLFTTECRRKRWKQKSPEFSSDSSRSARESITWNRARFPA